MREFREIRKQFQGDSRRAELYIGIARTLLGQVKQQAAMGNLSQLSRSVRMPDGVLIEVDTRFGQDRVRITAPVLGAPRAAPSSIATAPREIELNIDVPGRMIICGTAWFANDYIGAPDESWPWTGVPVVWYSPEAMKQKQLEGRSLGGVSEAGIFTRMTPDGKHICGEYTSGATGGLGMRWSHPGSVTTFSATVADLGSAFTNQEDIVNTAAGISADGRVIVGQSLDYLYDTGEKYKPFEWVDGRGVQMLALPGGATGGEATCISADGGVIGGLYEDAGFNVRAAWWDATRRLHTDPRVGTFILAANRDGSLLYGGEGAATPWVWRQGVRQALPQAPSPVWCCNLSGNVFAGTGPRFFVSDSGYRVTGHVNTWLFELGFRASTPAWLWTGSRVVSLGLGMPLAISPLGEYVVGVSGSWGQYVNTAGVQVRDAYPVLWSSSGDITKLPLPDGFLQGWASSISIAPGTASTYTAPI